MTNNTAEVLDFNQKSIEKLATDYLEYKRIKADADKALKELQEQIVSLMDGATEAVAGVMTVRNKLYSARQVDTDALKQDGLYDLYTKQVNRTRFTVTV